MSDFGKGLLESARRADTRREVLSDVDPVVLEAWRLQGRKVGEMLREAQAAVIELQEARDDLLEQVQTLAGLLKRCARCLPPEHATRKLATDYLRQHGHLSPLRTPGVAPSDDDEVMARHVEVEARDRRDARRYRWLRNSGRLNEDGIDGQIVVATAGGEDILTDEALDRQVDIAMNDALGVAAAPTCPSCGVLMEPPFFHFRHCAAGVEVRDGQA